MSDKTSTLANELHEKFSNCAEAPRTIVVPLDGSTDSEAALPLAHHLAGVFGASLRVVHAIDTGGDDDAAAVAAFEGYVTELAKQGRVPSGTATELAAGSAADVILADLEEGDLLVMASHGKGGIRAALFGSIADRVARATPVPAIIVPVGEDVHIPIDQVVIAVDESDCAAHAAAVGRMFAERCGASVTLVNAYLPTPLAVGLETPYVPLEAVKLDQQAAESLIAEVAAPTERAQAILGPTADAIADAAESIGAGLVVAGAHGRGFFGRLLMGSVSEGLMHRLHRPLLIVPARHSEKDPPGGDGGLT